MMEEKEKLRRELSKKTELSEEEIEALLSQYAKQMAQLDKMLGVERARQAAVRSIHPSPLLFPIFTNFKAKHVGVFVFGRTWRNVLQSVAV